MTNKHFNIIANVIMIVLIFYMIFIEKSWQTFLIIGCFCITQITKDKNIL